MHALRTQMIQDLQIAGLAMLTRRTAPGDDAHEQKLRRHLFDVTLTVSVSAPADAKDVAASRLRDITAAFGRFTSHEAWFTASPLRSRHINRTRRGFLMGSKHLRL